jgi:hypothetical protein
MQLVRTGQGEDNEEIRITPHLALLRRLTDQSMSKRRLK